jgi:hypothetical protein
VLGLNVFSGYRVTMDLVKGRLLLTPAADDAAGAPYWDVGGQMLVNVSADSGPEGLFLFDTGATQSMLARTFVDTIPGARIESQASVRTYGGPRCRCVGRCEVSCSAFSASRARAAWFTRRT